MSSRIYLNLKILLVTLIVLRFATLVHKVRGQLLVGIGELAVNEGHGTDNGVIVEVPNSISLVKHCSEIYKMAIRK